tara:strand:+ start:1072 stop:2235 length:1164 start_codon:yes stop_codon:yes gene_type:complete
LGEISKNTLISKSQKEFIETFNTSQIVTAVAPGRVNIIGEHTDYNMGMSIPIGINRWICAIASKRDDDKIRVLSSNFKDEINTNRLNISKYKKSWKNHVAGCIKTFKDEHGLKKGFNLLIRGNIPIGFGMSSSAALEVSILGCMMKLFTENVNYRNILKMSVIVENDYLKVKSGYLDQYSSIYSIKSSPMLIDFSKLSHRYIESKIKNGIWLLINSMVKRELTKSKYNERVNECILALEHINAAKDTKIAMNSVEDIDLTLLDNKTIKKRLRHILSENKRVKLMEKAISSGDLKLIGDILVKSHKSLSKNYEVSCKELDSILGISSIQNGFYGGRMMGGGFGGCFLCLICKKSKEEFSANVINSFEKEFNYQPEIEYIDFSDGLKFI